MSDPIPKFPDFSVSLDGSVAILAYNHPATGNSLQESVLEAKRDALKWAIRNPAVRVIVQTGTGKFFTTGRHMGGETASIDVDKVLNTFKELNELLITCPKVLIAAVNGPAIGYGTTCLALFDLVYSVPEAYFSTPFTKWALCPEGCSSVTFSSIMGHQKAAGLLLGGERMTAADLWTAGLITKVIPAESNAEFMTHVLKTAKTIADAPPVALATTKRFLDGDRAKELLAANERECEGLKERLSHQECKDALQVFIREQREKKVRNSHGTSRI